MKYFLKVLPVFLFSIFFISCSNDESTNDEEESSLDIIIGEWLFVSEHSYYCDTDEIQTARPGDEDIINTYVFKEDGTYEEQEDGMFSESGLWNKNEDGTYKITQLEDVYDDELSTYDIKNEFDGNDVLKWGVYGCADNDSDTYEYAKYERK